MSGMLTVNSEPEKIKKALIGRTIVDVDLGLFKDSEGDEGQAPCFTLDNGRKVFFLIGETDAGMYSAIICGV